MSKQEFSVQEEFNKRLSVTIPKQLAMAMGIKKETKVKWKVIGEKKLQIEIVN
jgi:antitoxin component of MazEF toxin-antitoxin module